MSKIEISEEILKKSELSEQTVKELFMSCLKTEKTQSYINFMTKLQVEKHQLYNLMVLLSSKMRTYLDIF